MLKAEALETQRSVHLSEMVKMTFVCFNAILDSFAASRMVIIFFLMLVGPAGMAQ